MKLVGVGFSLLFQIISSMFLTIGVFKINNLVYFETGSGIKKSQLFLHLGSYYLYLLSLIIFQIELAKSRNQVLYMNFLCDEFRVVSSIISQLLMLIILNKMCNMTIKIQERDSAQAPNTETDYYGQDSDNGSDESFIEES